MSLLDDLRAQAPALRNVDDETLKQTLRQQPEFRHYSDDQFEATISGRPSVSAEGRNSGFIGDLVDATQSGLYGVAQGVGDFTYEYTGVGRGLGDLGREGQARQLEQMSPRSAEDFQKPIFESTGAGLLDFKRGEGFNLRTIALQTASLGGEALATGLGAGSLARGGISLTGRAVGRSARQRAAAQGADEAGQRAAAVKAMEDFAASRTADGIKLGTYGLAEMAVNTGQIADGAYQEIMAMPDEELDQSAAFAELYWEMADANPEASVDELRQQAREQLGQGAKSLVMRDPALLLTTGALGGYGGKVLDDLVTKGTGMAGGRLGAALRQAAVQGTAETGQGGMGQYAINTGVADIGADPERNPMEGVAAAGLSEGVIGATMGGAAGAAAGRPNTQQAIDRARAEAAANGGDALDQAQAAQAAEQQAQGEQQAAEQSPEARAQRQQQASEIGLRIQRGMSDADELQAMARGSSFEGGTRLRNTRMIVERAETALENGNVEQAARLMDRADAIANNLRTALRTAGTRERPMEGELADPEAPQGDAPRLEGRRGQLPPGSGDSIAGESPQQFDARQRTQQEQADTLNRRSLGRDDVIYGDGPTRDPAAEQERRRAAFEQQYGTAQNTGLDGEYLGPDALPGRPNRQGDTYDGETYRRPEQLRQDTAPRILQSGTIYGQGPTAGNANTGMEQPFERARFTDTGARDAVEGRRPQQQESAERTAQLARTRGRGQTTYLPDNTPIRTRARVVDTSELIASNTPDGRVNPAYPQELQPRDRTNANSQVQVRNIATRLNPERLGASNDAGTGAPIIGSDGVVESGNGRTMAITTAYGQNSPQAERYREFVRAEAERQGIDPSAVDEMQQPVLVRERITNVDRADFARRANESQVAGMTAYEQAQADADSLTADDLQAWSPDESGDPLAATNRGFQRGFVQRLGNNEASRYTTRDGQATPELGQRMQRAVFAAAYQDPDMVEMVTEQAENMRNLAAGLQAAAADLAVARETGSRDALDAIGTINDAVRLVRRSRQDGISVRELTRQTDAFTDAVPETTALLAIAINNNMRSRQAMTTAFSYIGRAVRNRAEGEANGALFADDTTNQDIFDAGFQGQNQNQRTEQRPPEGNVQSGAQRRQSGAQGQGQTEPTQRPQAAQQAQEVDDAPLLNTYTEQELAEREQAQQQAEEAETSQQREQEQRAQADAEADDFTLSGSNRTADIAASRGQNDLLGSRMESSPPNFTRASMSNFPDAIIQAGLGVERESDSYQLAKAGDVEAAQRYVEQVVNGDAVQAIYNQLQGRSPIVTPVRAQEEAGRNKIPSAYASLLSEALDLPLDNSIVQANRPQRTSKDGLGRLFAQPVFEGEVQRGRDYLIVDDTLTQGGTFAALKGYIEQNGGNVILASALTGKQYSAKLSPEPALLADVRTKFGDIETDFTETLGYGYDQLTQSEARYISRLTTKAEEFRDFVTQGRDADRREAPVSPVREQPQGEPAESNAAPVTPNASDNPSTPQNTSPKRRNKPLEYTGYSGEQRNVRSYQEVGNFRIAKVNDSLYEVINTEGQTVSQRAGPSGAAEEAARLNDLPADDQRYAIGQSDARPVSRDAIEEALASSPELSDVTVIQSATELPAQSILMMALQGVNPRDVRGLFVGDHLYVIADNVDDVQEGVRTAVHEAVGHKGMRAVLGDDLDRVMLGLYRSLPNSKEGRAALREVRRDYPFLDHSKREDRITVAEEMVAHLLEKGHRPKAWQRAVAKIRQLLRRLFPTVGWNYLDALALGEQSREYLQKRKAENNASNEDDSQRYALRSKQRTPFGDHFDDFDEVDKAAAGKIGPQTPKQRAGQWMRERWQRAGTKIRQGIVDRYASLKELDEAAYGDGVLTENMTASSWVLARMANAANGAVSAMMTAGRIYYDKNEKVIDVREDGEQHGLAEVFASLGESQEIERFMGWIAGNRSARLAEEGRENLFTPDEIARMQQWNKGTMADGSSREQRYKKAFEEFQQYRDDVLSIAEDAGIISEDQRAMWRDEFYVPFYRVNEDQQVTGMMPGGGLSRQQAYKKLKGGTGNLNDLLQNTLLNFHHLLDASLKNIAATQAIDNAQAVGIAEQVPETGRDTTTSTFIMRKGRKEFYQVNDPLVFNSLTALAHTGFNSSAMKVLRFFKRTFTNLVTATPQFQLANLMRDSMQAVATSDVSKNALGNVIKGGRSYRDELVKARMMASGGAFNFGHIYGQSPDELRAALTRELSNTKLIQTPSDALGVVKTGWQRWMDFNNYTENINRAAIWEQNQERGKLAAAFEARDLIDFGAQGAWPATRFLVDVVPFLNARIQGLDKIYRSGIKPGTNVVLAALGKGDASVTDKQLAGRFWAVTGALASATMMLYLNNYDEEWYKELDEWHKDTYWSFKMGDAMYSIPKPFEVGAIATIAERLLEQGVNDDATGKLFGQRMTHMMMQTFSFSPVPQAVQPALNIYSNKDDFTGRPIESMGMDRLSPELRTRNSTTVFAEWISQGLNSTVGAIGDPENNPLALSPVQVDHLIGGYFGQIGSTAAGMGDTILRTAMGETNPARRWYEYQPVRRFYRSLGDEPFYTRYGTVFYEGLREAQRAQADVNKLQEWGRLEEARKVARSNEDMLRLRLPLQRAQTQLRTINNQMDTVRRSALAPELKRQRLDRLMAMRNQLQRTLGQQVDRARSN